MGVFESEKFARGTHAIAAAIADLTDQGAMSVVAGGETVRAPLADPNYGPNRGRGERIYP
eukprot:8465111-Pyramimonas_sp.AAC.1